MRILILAAAALLPAHAVCGQTSTDAANLVEMEFTLYGENGRFDSALGVALEDDDAPLVVTHRRAVYPKRGTQYRDLFRNVTALLEGKVGIDAQALREFREFESLPHYGFSMSVNAPGGRLHYDQQLRLAALPDPLMAIMQSLTPTANEFEAFRDAARAMALPGAFAGMGGPLPMLDCPVPVPADPPACPDPAPGPVARAEPGPVPMVSGASRIAGEASGASETTPVRPPLRPETGELRAALAAQEDRNGQLEAEIAVMALALDRTRTESATLRGQLDKAEARNADLSAQLAAARREIAALVEAAGNSDRD